MAKAVPVAERAALAAIRADSEDAWAHYALASVYLFNRRFDDCIAEFELALRLNPNFSPARGIYGVALSYRGRWEEGDRAAREALQFSPARSLCRDLLRRRRLLPVCRQELRGGDPPVARGAAPARRLRRRPPRADGRRSAWPAAPTPPRPRCEGLRRAQPNISLAWLGQRDAVRARGGQGALSGRVSAGGVAIIETAIAARRYLKLVWTVNHSGLKVLAEAC